MFLFDLIKSYMQLEYHQPEVSDRYESSTFCEHCGFPLIEVHVIHCKDCHCIVHENCETNATKNYVKAVNVDKEQLRISDFDFVKELGKGSYGKVILAKQTRRSDITEQCAIKVINKNSIIHKKRVENIMAEKNVLILAAQSSFLTELYSCFQTKNHLLFVMEYVKGGDLASHLKWVEKFDENRSAFYVSAAVQFLHRNGVIYRDLKLENILLDHEGHCKLVDFGLCKIGEVDGMFASTVCGTPSYIAPELLQRKKYDASADWWSLGVLVYKCLTGYSPFIAKNKCDLFNSIIHDPVLFPAWTSCQSVSFIKGLLTKNPLHRLGCSGPNRDSHMKNHSFFKYIDWKAREQRRVKPPFRPKIKNPKGTLNYDKIFGNETPTSMSIQQNGNQMLRLILNNIPSYINY